MSPRPIIGLVTLSAGLLACPSVEPPPATPPANAALPAPGPSAAPAAPQAFAAAGDEVAYVFADPDRRKKLESAFPAIDALGEAELRDAKLPGFVMGILIDGELAYARGFGFADIEKKTKADLDTVYRIASNTKSFTALAVLALRDDETLALDDSLPRWIPEASGLVYPTHDAPPITLRQLLTHTSGLPRIGTFDNAVFDHLVTEEEITRSLPGFALEAPPGTAYRYSNLGYGLLGLVVGRASRTPWQTFVKRRLLDPLGMTSATYDPDAVPATRLATQYQRSASGGFEPAKVPRLGASGGVGGLYASLRDQARYLAFQMDAYPPRSAPETGPVRRSTLRESHFDAIRGDGSSADNYGYGWAFEESCELGRLVWHAGGGAGAAAWWAFLPENGVGVMVSTNLMAGGGVGKKALMALKKTGGLSRRVGRMSRLSPALEAVMPGFLTVLNAWDEEGYKAMVTKPLYGPSDADNAELAGYRATHGACKGYTPIEISSPLNARFVMQCERGALEMLIRLSPADGLIQGFVGTSRDISAPPELVAAADRLVGLIGKWDVGVYRKHLAPKAAKTEAETVAFFAGLRAGHGSCKVKSFSRRANRPDFLLECERGGALKLSPKLDDKDTALIVSYSITEESPPACPAK